MAYASGMHDAITRSTFAYATFLFVVLFAPQVGFEHHHGPGGNLISTFPDVLTLVLTCVVLWLAVRHATLGHTDALFARGFARGAAVSAIGGVLYAIGLAFVAPAVYSSQTFAWMVVLLSVVEVAAIGSGLSAIFAYFRARGASAAKPA